jgi:hypothetical protein
MSGISLETFSLSTSIKNISGSAITSDLPLDNQILLYDSSQNIFKYETINTSAQSDANYLRLDGTNLPTSHINLNSNKITNLADPTVDKDAVNKEYVDDNFLKLDGTNLPSANINLNSNKIINLADPTADKDAVNKEYVDDASNNKVSKTGDIMTGDLITNTGSGPVRNIGCDDLSSGTNTFNVLMGNSQNKITYSPSVGPIVTNALNGMIINQNGTDVMRIGKGGSDTRIDVYKDLLLNQNFISDVKDPSLDKDAVTKIYADSLMYMTASPLMTAFSTTINGLTYQVSNNPGLTTLNPSWNVFRNNNILTRWQPISSTTNVWIDMRYPNPISMKGFGIITNSASNITSWKIQASNDGTTYIDIIPSNTTLFQIDELFTFNFTPSIPYQNWRFLVETATAIVISTLRWIPSRDDITIKKNTTGFIPRLTSNIAHRGFIPLASSEATASFLACNAFRQDYVANPGTNGEWASTTTTNGWIQITSLLPVRIWKIGVRARDDDTKRVLNWNLQASFFGGTSYVTIYKPSAPTVIDRQYSEYQIDSLSEFNVYRLNIISAAGTNPGISVFQIFTYI